MSKSKVKLPKINSFSHNMSPINKKSSIQRFSRQLNSISINQQKFPKNQKKRIVHKRYLPLKQQQQQNRQQNNLSALKQCKQVLEQLKNQLQKKTIQKQIIITQKFNKINRLTKNSDHNNQDTSRSYNYINVNPTQHYLYSFQPYFYPSPIPQPQPQQLSNYFEQNDEYQNNKSISQFKHHLHNHHHRKKKKKHKTQVSDDQQNQVETQRVQKNQKNQKNERSTKSVTKLALPHENPQIAQRSINKLLNKKKIISLMKIKKWRVIVWMIIFIKLLQKLHKKIINFRLSIFSQFQKRNFNIQMLLFQKYIVKKCKPFFLNIYNRKQISLYLQQFETAIMQNEKSQLIKKLINILLDGINQIKINDKNQPAMLPIQIIYLFCRHGSFTCNKYMTTEQLQTVPISDKGYVKMDKNIQKSQIINFLFNKIILCNILLHPEKVDKGFFPPSNTILTRNFYLIGSIWYQLCMQIQDQYLSKIPIQNYELGNWIKYKNRIHPAKSLMINCEDISKQSMTSGMINKQKIQKIFGSNFWKKQKYYFRKSIQYLHNIIVQFHKKVIQTAYFQKLI